MNVDAPQTGEHQGSTPAPGSGQGPGFPRGFPATLGIIAELKRRNLFRIAILYLIACWVILEPTHVVFHMLEVPEWANRLVILLMAIGFPLVLLFAWIFEVTPEGLKLTSEVDRARSNTRETGRKLDKAIIGVLSVAILLLLADRFWPFRIKASPKAEPPASAAQAAPAATGPAAAPAAVSDKSITVLPFADMSEKKDQEYFSDGLAEELLDLLAKVPQLQVTARTSSFSFKGKSDDIPTIAHKLNVANILEGSVRKSGVRLRVTTELIRADSGVHIWSETYDRELKDVFQVQDEIAGAVVSALKVHLLPTQVAANDHRTSSTEAYNQYLLGRQFLNRANMDAFRRALKAFHRAVELDPGYAAAYAQLSGAEYIVADWSGESAGKDRAEAEAQKAIELAPQLGLGYAARASVRAVYRWDWSGAQADLRRALELEPGDSDIRSGYAAELAGMGRLPEAIEAAGKAVELDPLNARVSTQLAMLLTANRQFAPAHQALESSLEVNPESDPAHLALGELHLLEGRPSEALASFRAIDASGLRLTGVAICEGMLGHPAQSQQALDELIAKNSNDAAYQVAEVYAWRSDKDKAFEWLERAYRQRDGGLSNIKFDPLLANLTHDPRFDAMLKKLNLPQ